MALIKYSALVKEIAAIEPGQKYKLEIKLK
jgi:hypothetical protein